MIGRRAGKVWYGILQDAESALMQNVRQVEAEAGDQASMAAIMVQDVKDVEWAPARKLLVHRATEEVVSSYEALEVKLFASGWERASDAPPSVREYHREDSPGPFSHFLSLPNNVEFRNLKTIHLYNIVVQTRTAFELRDVILKTYHAKRPNV